MFFFFGWGKKHKAWDVGNGKHVIATWGYFFFLLFAASGKVSYTLAGDVRSEDQSLTYEEAKRLLPGVNIGLGILERFGLWIVLGIVFLTLLWSYAYLLLIPYLLLAVYEGLENKKWRQQLMYTLAGTAVIVFGGYLLIDTQTEYWAIDNLLGMFTITFILGTLVTFGLKSVDTKKSGT